MRAWVRGVSRSARLVLRARCRLRRIEPAAGRRVARTSSCSSAGSSGARGCSICSRRVAALRPVVPDVRLVCAGEGDRDAVARYAERRGHRRRREASPAGSGPSGKRALLESAAVLRAALVRRSDAPERAGSDGGGRAGGRWPRLGGVPESRGRWRERLSAAPGDRDDPAAAAAESSCSTASSPRVSAPRRASRCGCAVRRSARSRGWATLYARARPGEAFARLARAPAGALGPVHVRYRRLDGSAAPRARRRRDGGECSRRSRIAGPTAPARARSRRRASASVLGHRRLAIIDPEGARQPMCDEAGGPRAHVQRRDLQLPRAARRARRRAATASRATPTPRCCCAPTSTGASERGRAPARHVRLRDLGRAQRSACSSRATASARSRCSCCEDGGGSVFASEIKALLQLPRHRARRRTCTRCGTTSPTATCRGRARSSRGIRKLAPGTCATWERGRLHRARATGRRPTAMPRTPATIRNGRRGGRVPRPRSTRPCACRW